VPTRVPEEVLTDEQIEEALKFQVPQDRSMTLDEKDLWYLKGILLRLELFANERLITINEIYRTKQGCYRALLQDGKHIRQAMILKNGNWRFV
jgi:hypothetical protein